MTDAPCPHGLTPATRREIGCRGCDADARDAMAGVTPPSAEETGPLCALLVAASRPENPVPETVHQALHRQAAQRLLAAAREREQMAKRLAEYEPINLLFTSPPGPDSQFIEAETSDGRSVCIGEWDRRADGTWVLRIQARRFLQTGGAT